MLRFTVALCRHEVTVTDVVKTASVATVHVVDEETVLVVAQDANALCDVLQHEIQQHAEALGLDIQQVKGNILAASEELLAESC